MRKQHGHSLHDHIVRELGKQIVSGRWPVGSPIPADTILCATLNVSRTALREGLVSLAAKGLLEARQKVGTVVRPQDQWNMLDGDILLWRVESAEGDHVVAELYDLRRLLEPLAASLAATHATPWHIEILRKAYEDMALAGDDGLKVHEPDVRFHCAVIGASGNSLFASLGLVIASALDVNFKAIKDSPRGHAWALPLHEAIVDAISARDPKAARLAMQQLLDASEVDLQTARANNPARPTKTRRGIRSRPPQR
jgi:DNA-binding FadR family transcriptional regulator